MTIDEMISILKTAQSFSYQGIYHKYYETLSNAGIDNGEPWHSASTIEFAIRCLERIDNVEK